MSIGIAEVKSGSRHPANHTRLHCLYAKEWDRHNPCAFSRIGASKRSFMVTSNATWRVSSNGTVSSDHSPSIERLESPIHKLPSLATIASGFPIRVLFYYRNDWICPLRLLLPSETSSPNIYQPVIEAKYKGCHRYTSEAGSMGCNTLVYVIHLRNVRWFSLRAILICF